MISRTGWSPPPSGWCCSSIQTVDTSLVVPNASPIRPRRSLILDGPETNGFVQSEVRCMGQAPRSGTRQSALLTFQKPCFSISSQPVCYLRFFFNFRISLLLLVICCFKGDYTTLRILRGSGFKPASHKGITYKVVFGWGLFQLLVLLVSGRVYVRSMWTKG